jgi:hypothetical protein
MRKLIIHGGMPKAGSTALQNFLFSNQERLLSNGILFPSSGRFSERAAAHHAFFRSFVTETSIKPLMRAPEPVYSPEMYSRMLSAEISEFRPQVVILSSEQVFELALDVALLQRLRTVLPKAQVHVYFILRKQDEFLCSAYAQRVTGPQNYYGTPMENLEFLERRGLFDYEKIFSNLTYVFGKHSISFRWHHELGGRVAQPLAEITGLSEDIFSTPVSTANKRRSWAEVEVLRAMNRYFANRSSMRKIARHIVRAFFDITVHRFLEDPASLGSAPYDGMTLNAVRQRYDGANSRLYRYSVPP